MKQAFRSVAAITIILCSTAVTGPKDRSAAEQIASMGWLAGTWEGPMGSGTYQAYYCTPEGGKIMSYNTLRKAGRVTFHEFEVFEEEAGKVVFRPFPGGKPATTLTLSKCNPKARKAVFENPDKDFPTRITYQRKSKDRLVITLSDPHNDSPKTQVFDLKRK